MIRKQIENVKAKLHKQVRAVFGDRRKNTQKRTFLESMFMEQTVTKDREIAMTLYTQVLRRLNELMLNDKDRDMGLQGIIDMIKDEN